MKLDAGRETENPQDEGRVGCETREALTVSDD
jgi:hypothetical protein